MADQEPKRKVYAIVSERIDEVFAFFLTEEQIDDLGAYGIEISVMEWCQKHGLTYVDFAT